MVSGGLLVAYTALAGARAMWRRTSVIWPPPRWSRPRAWVGAATLCAGLLLTPAAPVGGQEVPSPDVRLVDLDGRPVAPLAEAAGKIVVFIFATYDCPISNRYAPEVRRLHERFAEHAQFWLVYPDPTIAPAVLRQHGLEYDYPFGALRDLKHELVSLTGVKVTPEVAVFDRARRLVYRGRIDDRVVDFGKVRVVPTRRDLEDVLQRVVAGARIVPSTTDAIGCYIPPL